MRKYVVLVIVLIGLVVIGLVSRQSKPKTVDIPTGSYVALGDSVAAGVGLKTDSDSSACDRTNESYPNLVAQQMNFKLYSLACSGATMNSGILGKQDVNQLMVSSQLDQLFKLSKPSLITITIGANDIDWTSIIGKCYTSVCGSAEDTTAVNQKLATLATDLKSALSQIQSHYKNDPPNVVVTGYHQVFPASVNNCPDLTGIDHSELSWGRDQQTSLNKTINSSVASFNFVKFANIDFKGHELCTPDSWVQGISDKDPYHPTEDGQAAFANSVVSAAVSLRNQLQ